MPPSRAAQQSERVSSRAVRVGSRIVLGVAVLLLAAAVSLLWFRASYDDKVYPGVHVAGVDIGGMSHASAVAAIEAKANEIEESRAYFDYEGQHWGPTLRELGVTVDVEASVDQAFAIGREDAALSRLESAITAAREETWLPLQVELSAETLQAWSEGVDRDLGIEPKNATLEISGTQVIIDPEVDGTIVDRTRLQSLLTKSVANLEAPTSSLPVMPRHPTVFVSDYDNVKAQLEASLSAPVEVHHDGKQWEIAPEEFAQFVSTELDPTKVGEAAISIRVDERSLANWLNDLLASEVNKDPVNAEVAWNGERVIALTESQQGAKLLPASLASSLTGSFFDGHQALAIPTTVVEPEVDSRKLDALGITTKLGVGSSNFDGSDEARATNIIVGANLMNGTLVPPGGEFSFHHAIGAIGPDLGFVEAQVIDGEFIGTDYGGGICQVSTTVFRAALYSGLPITEWWPHRFRLGFYELDGWTAGLDASILQPPGDPFSGGNFKFANPTDSWLLVESYVEWPRVYVVVYGPDLGYDVTVSDPIMGKEHPPIDGTEFVDEKLPPGTIKQTEWEQPGLEVSYVRTVRGPDGEVVREDTWDTHFYARGNVYKVSPDMKGKSPAAKSP